MKRRDVLLGGGWTLAQLAAPKSFADCSVPKTRAAVVIGVNKAGKLPILRAAVSGAKSVADWLCGEGFETKVIVDESEPVTVAAIKQAVFELVDRGTLTHLVIYFSGHGVCVGFNEYWLLSGAPADSNEAVTLRESWELAHRVGIPNVVFISDACRSIPEYNASLLTGALIFPNTTSPPGVSGKVDRFLATEPGQSSIEAKDAVVAYSGVYTSVFLDAFKKPQEGMVQTIDGEAVIPSRLLDDYLRKEVPRRLAAIDLKHRQIPETRLECRDNFYIGRALKVASPVVSAVVGEKNTRIFDVLNKSLATTHVGTLGPVPDIYAETLNEIARQSGFESAKASISTAKSARSFETETGFAINGVRVLRAISTAGTVVEVLPDSAEPVLVRVTPAGERPATVALMFNDGSGTVIAALRGFIGTVTVENGLVTSVTYAPSVGGSRAYESGDQKARLTELHALVGAAAKFGAFRIEGDEKSRASAAERLASQIRMMKGVDPTLGIYAAYAYADANLIDQVQSVKAIMRNDLNGDLFDVALLANALSGRRIDNYEPTPCCPMLSQGWQLLRVKNVSLPKPIEEARYDLRDALWTTFGPRGMQLVFGYIQQVGTRNNG